MALVTASMDDRAMVAAVENCLYLREQGWFDDTKFAEEVKAHYIELFGPDALKDSPDEADCDD